MNIHSHRTGRLRETMSARGWDAVIVSSSDPHNSEYPAPRWKTIEWLSGFTGEAADLVITADEAGLWTDSRYFIQAVSELRAEPDKKEACLLKAAQYDKNDRFQDYLKLYRKLLEE